MIAVAKIGGHQAIVKVGDVLHIDRVAAEVGKTVKFDVLLLSDEDGKNCTVGAPLVDGQVVEAKVLSHLRGDKIRVYKMKPRKRYRRTIGHRQELTEVEITKVGGSTAKASTSAKATEDKKPKAKKAAAKADDLTKVEGIGPKIAEHLNEAGIVTYADLAKASKKKLTEVLEAAGPRYKAHDPSTWAQQAKLAKDGDWDELKTLQDKLDGGKKA